MSFRTGKPPATAERSVADENLATFDRLDFDSWNAQDWDLFEEIHAPDVVVRYPDGSTTEGIEAHTRWAKEFFAAFDSRIGAHPIKTATGEWTSVVGEMEVTFARPMKKADGAPVPPTGKTWKGRMCTVARWRDGRIAEEILFWDNLALRKGVGLA